MSKPDSSIQYFEKEAVRHALTLPVDQAKQFLLGMLAATSGQEFEATRRAYTNFVIGVEQLQLIGDA